MLNRALRRIAHDDVIRQLVLQPAFASGYKSLQLGFRILHAPFNAPRPKRACLNHDASHCTLNCMARSRARSHAAVKSVASRMPFGFSGGELAAILLNTLSGQIRENALTRINASGPHQGTNLHLNGTHQAVGLVSSKAPHPDSRTMRETAPVRE
jgi:hypothetical protein